MYVFIIIIESNVVKNTMMSTLHRSARSCERRLHSECIRASTWQYRWHPSISNVTPPTFDLKNIQRLTAWHCVYHYRIPSNGRFTKFFHQDSNFLTKSSTSSVHLHTFSVQSDVGMRHYQILYHSMIRVSIEITRHLARYNYDIH